jgi:hypothetical protein
LSVVEIRRGTEVVDFSLRLVKEGLGAYSPTKNENQ